MTVLHPRKELLIAPGYVNCSNKAGRAQEIDAFMSTFFYILPGVTRGSWGESCGLDSEVTRAGSGEKEKDRQE